MQLLAANCLFLSETRRIPRTAADPYSPVSILASIAAPNLGQSDHITGLKPTKFNHRQGLVLFSSHRGGTKIVVLLAFPALARTRFPLVHSGFPCTHESPLKTFFFVATFAFWFGALTVYGDDPDHLRLIVFGHMLKNGYR